MTEKPVQIYLHQNGDQVGPFSASLLKTKMENKELIGDEEAWYDGLDGWQPLRDVLYTAGAVPAGSKPSFQAKPSPTAASGPAAINRIVITGVEIPFWKLVKLILTTAIACVPAIIFFALFWIGCSFVLVVAGWAFAHLP